MTLQKLSVCTAINSNIGGLTNKKPGKKKKSIVGLKIMKKKYS
jgi:hypothetical protein